jgi:DivIVA domain-containing protein
MRPRAGRRQYHLAMDLTSKLLRDVEFRDRLRGYDTDEVDEFLERVAVGVDELHAELAAVRAKAPASPSVTEALPRSPIEDDDSIRRTLVLAQRTADLAISEARAEADHLLEHARSESQRVLVEAKDAAERISSDAEVELTERVSRLTERRDALEREVRTLSALIDGERERMADALTLLQSQVGDLRLSEAFAAAATRNEPAAPPVPPPAFLADDPAEAFDETSTDLELDLDLTIAAPPERPVTAPTPVTPPETPTVAAPDVDEALWERWASSADVDDRPAEDPFRFGPSE